MNYWQGRNNNLFWLFLFSGLDYKSMGKIMAAEIRRGLEDFCGQVRIAAAAACRKFMINMDPGQKDDLLPMMLPMLCLCRYYVADTKFLLYSQETWKVVFASEGPILVAKHVDSVVQLNRLQDQWQCISPFDLPLSWFSGHLLYRSNYIRKPRREGSCLFVFGRIGSKSGEECRQPLCRWFVGNLT